MLVDGFIGLTEIQIKRGQYKWAKLYAHRAFNIDENSEVAKVNYSHSCFFLGEETKALSYYNSLIDNSDTPNKLKRFIKDTLKSFSPKRKVNPTLHKRIRSLLKQL